MNKNIWILIPLFLSNFILSMDKKENENVKKQVTLKKLKNFDEPEAQASLGTRVILKTLNNGQCRCFIPESINVVYRDGFTLNENTECCKKLTELVSAYTDAKIINLSVTIKDENEIKARGGYVDSNNNAKTIEKTNFENDALDLLKCLEEFEQNTINNLKIEEN